MLAILMIIILAIIVITAVIIILIQIGGLGNKQFGKWLIIIGEYCLCINVCLLIIVNTGILGEFSNSDTYVMKESLKEVAMQVDKIERETTSERVAAYEKTDTESTLAKISSLEEQVKSSDFQVKVANAATGIISMVGTILMFSGKLMKQRDERM